MGSLAGYFVGLIGGAAVGVQSVIAGAMGQRVGGTASSLIIHISGAIFSGLLLFAAAAEKIRELAEPAMVHVRCRHLWAYPVPDDQYHHAAALEAR